MTPAVTPACEDVVIPLRFRAAISFDEESQDSPYLPTGDENEEEEEDAGDEDGTRRNHAVATGDLEEVMTDLGIVNQFSRKQKKGFIDVWWLFDDGGQSVT